MEVVFVYCLISYCIKPFCTTFFESLGSGSAEKILNKHKKTTPAPTKQVSGK